jgi:hypothetical protein
MLYSNLKQKCVLLSTMVLFSFPLFSLVAPGGDSYSVYLNNKLVFTQWVTQPAISLKKVQLGPENYHDMLMISYSHCGVVGKGRSIVIKDEQNNILKEWKFQDPTGSEKLMSIPAKEILDLKKNNSTLELFYFSAQQLPKGRMLALLSVEKKGNAKSAVAKN